MTVSEATTSTERMFQRPERSLWGDAAYRFSRNKLSMTALVMALFLITVAVFAPWIAPTHYDKQVYSETWQTPSREHLMGTDPFGRDVVSRIVYGARISLSVGFVVQIVSLLIGAPIGALAGWFGGAIEYLLMRIVDIMSAFPTLLFAILLLTALGSGLGNIFLVISLTSWIGVARLFRGQILSLREQDFVLAAKSIGATDRHIMFRHLIPNSLVPIIVGVTLGIPSAIFAEAGLSFLGIGVHAPIPSWGKMVNEYLPYIQTNWYLSTFPAIMIALTMYAFTLMGDGLQDALNPTASRNQ